jgi:hypothetical protein
MSNKTIRKFTILIIIIINSLNLLTFTLSENPTEISDPILKKKFDFYTKINSFDKDNNLEIFLEENDIFIKTKNKISIKDNTPSKILDLQKDYVFLECKYNIKIKEILT